MVADVNAKWELFASIVWALLSNIIFIVIVLFVIWSLVKTTEFDKKIKRLISSEIERKILAWDINKTWFKIKKNPLEGLDLFFVLFFKISLIVFVIGGILLFSKGPWYFRMPFGLSLYVWGDIGIGVAVIMRGILKYRVKFLKILPRSCLLWLFGTVWVAWSLSWMQTEHQIVTLLDKVSGIIMILGIVVGAIFLVPIGLTFLIDASEHPPYDETYEELEERLKRKEQAIKAEDERHLKFLRQLRAERKKEE